MPKVLKFVGALLLACAVSVGAQTFSTVLNGLVYTFPTSDGTTGQVLVNDGAGTLSWVTASPGGSAVMPTNLIVFTDGACPSGYANYNTANGFYPVGATTGLAGTVGTGLSVGENRATGAHTHSASGTVGISSGSHNHTITDTGHSHAWNPVATGSYGREPQIIGEPPNDYMEDAPGVGVQSGASRTSDSSGTGMSVGNTSISASGSVTDFTINNGGTGTGTNAPYRQLRMCQKS